MEIIYFLKKDVFLNDSHLAKAGAKVKMLDISCDEATVVLINDPFGEQYRVDKDMLGQ